MLLTQVTIGTTDVEALERFHRDVLLLPVQRVSATAIDVEVGSGTVRYEQRPQFSGAHHMAFSVAPEDFDKAHGFLDERVEILTSGDSPVIYAEGLGGRSVYFNAPDGLILEYIAYESHRGGGSSEGPPALTGISEVGIGVEDVSATVDELTSLGIPLIQPQGAVFSTVGNIDSRLVIVDQERLWFPEMRERPATDISTIHLTVEGATPGRKSLERAELMISSSYGRSL